MKFIAIADSDVGISKDTNQDSVLIKHAEADNNEVLMAIVCDGMGGLAKGELASATVIRAFDKWFDEELPYELENPDMQVIGGKWELLLKDLNIKIQEYSVKFGADMGTTFSGILFIGNQYLIVHVGDTRIYHIGNAVSQLTEDQTFIAREISRGTMTYEQAMQDKRRNMLLQCIGASKVVEPQIVSSVTKKGTYLLCSDGFRHEITEDEIYEKFKPVMQKNQKEMHSNAKFLIEKVKDRQEKDNISVILIKVD